jgi:hypothetical protein
MTIPNNPYIRCYGCDVPPEEPTGYGSEPTPIEDPFYNYDETPNYAYRHTMPFGCDTDSISRYQPQVTRVSFGGFTAKELAITGGISYLVTRWLGASVPGAIVMGVGNMLWEAGSSNIMPGWKRYILGLFRKPHE